MILGRKTKWLLSISIIIVLVIFIIRSIIGYYLVVGPAMSPTLSDGDRTLVNKFSYHFKIPEHNDILVFRYPGNPKRELIKRVIAVPGDTIEIKEGQVFLNGQLQNETYIQEYTRGSFPLYKIPEGHIFVMGDNRNNSEDSRFKGVGFVPYDLIIGKVVYTEKTQR